MIANDLTELVGKTPMVRLRHIVDPNHSNLIAKCEFFNPCSSVKDRIGLAMIEAAEKDGSLQKGGTIIEATSGNTGIALAWIAAIRGYRLILTMPDSMSLERRQLFTAFGASIELTPGAKGMRGAVELAEELSRSIKGSVLMRQFDNSANPEIHIKTTAEEIWSDTDGKIDLFVAGVGTGGTITGVGRVLKERKPTVKIIAVEPEDSPVLSGGSPNPHAIQGIGAGFVPSILDRTVIDEIMLVKAEDAKSKMRQLAKKEGILAGISSGANLSAACEIAKRPENQNKMIVVMLPDTGERYLSMSFFD